MLNTCTALPSRLGPWADVCPSSQQPCGKVWQPQPRLSGPAAGVYWSGQQPCSVYWQPQPARAAPRARVTLSGQQPYTEYSQPQPASGGERTWSIAKKTTKENEESCPRYRHLQSTIINIYTKIRSIYNIFFILTHTISLVRAQILIYIVNNAKMLLIWHWCNECRYIRARALYGANFWNPIRSAPFAQTQIHPYPWISEKIPISIHFPLKHIWVLKSFIYPKSIIMDEILVSNPWYYIEKYNAIYMCWIIYLHCLKQLLSLCIELKVLCNYILHFLFIAFKNAAPLSVPFSHYPQNFPISTHYSFQCILPYVEQCFNIRRSGQKRFIDFPRFNVKRFGKGFRPLGICILPYVDISLQR